MTKACRPRLTAKVADSLRSLAGFAEAGAEAVMDGTDEQREHAKEILAAVGWIRRLTYWHAKAAECRQEEPT